MTSPAAITNRSVIPFNQLPDPTIIETLDFETILAEMKADLITRAPELESALQLESDPALKILETCAYRVMIERQNANEKARRLLLAKGKGPELDHLGALPWVLTPRKTITPADPDATPPIAAIVEDDDVYRLRLQLALEGWSVAGPTGAYIYHALRADDLVKDIAVKAAEFERLTDIAGMPPNSFLLGVADNAGLVDPIPGDVAIAVLSVENDGTATTELLTAVENYLNDRYIRPTTDRPRAISAEIISFRVEATIYCYPGPDRSVVIANATTALETYVTNNHRCGYDITASGIHNALHQAGVQRAPFVVYDFADQPYSITDDIVISVDWQQAAYCTNINITDGGVDV